MILLNVLSRLIWFTATEVVFGGLEYIEVQQFSFRPTNHTAACAKPLRCKCCTSAVNLLRDEKTTVQSSQLVWTNIHNHKKKPLTTNRITLWNMSNNCTTIRTGWVSHFLCHFERWDTSNKVTHHNQPREKKKKKRISQDKMRSATKLEGERSFFFFFSSWRSNQGNKGTGHQENNKKKIHYNNHVTTTVDGSWSRQFWLCLNVKSHIQHLIFHHFEANKKNPHT